MPSHIADTVLLVRPSHFVFNHETAVSNAFQNKLELESEDSIKQKAFEEFDLFAAKLRARGVHVFVFDDTPTPQKPDAVFPNNWVSFHEDGRVILYPMLAENRRHERRLDIIDTLKQDFEISEVLDLSPHEKEGRFLEGTGSIVFDHKNKIAYACLSPRTDKELFLEVCKYLKYQPVYFNAHDKNGVEIYHTNVMMCVAEKFAVICMESVDENDREKVRESLESTGHEIVEISFEQMANFVGNMLSLMTKDGACILAMSGSAYECLTEAQKEKIGCHCELLYLPIKTIETIGGGSARCMIAEIFLKRKN